MKIKLTYFVVCDASDIMLMFILFRMKSEDFTNTVRHLLLEELSDVSDFKLCMEQYKSFVHAIVSQQNQVLAQAVATTTASIEESNSFDTRNNSVVLKLEGRQDENTGRKRRKIGLDRRIFRSRNNPADTTENNQDVTEQREPEIDTTNVHTSNYCTTYDDSCSGLDASSNQQHDESSSHEVQQNFILLQNNTPGQKGSSDSAETPTYLIPISAEFLNSAGVEQQFVEIENETEDDAILVAEGDGGHEVLNPEVIHLTPDMRSHILALLAKQDGSANAFGQVQPTRSEMDNGSSNQNNTSHQ